MQCFDPKYVFGLREIIAETVVFKSADKMYN